MSTTDAKEQWAAWREQRTRTVSAPYGPLALTGTYWLADAPDGRIPGVPGRWTEDPGTGDAVLLTALAEDGLTVNGEPFEGWIRLGPDASAGAVWVAHGERRLLVLRREGQWAVRVFDPQSAARQAFAGIDAFDYDERWVLSGTFRPYAGGRTVVPVENADGRERGLSLAGELALGSGEHTLQVGAEEDGSLWAVFADGTSGTSSYRFRFLRPPAPDPDGTVTVDFNRAHLPPCAFAEHFICPFPPPGNTLPFAVPAGERCAHSG
ncbi:MULTISPECIES: DUF1684 domain-containing protein [Streptomyces]|uniref:DUF1684 domain-containing protein n=1 Tax=Streptomyces morookaense TaxID=1970 RepID=A0A7Y7B3Q3_STRMO|nr:MULTISPECIES: DUF1684 domain-containing protein [Streptomyces]MCC2276282.1 DUF1684 domain-containing protein [Streptomyces sp. ET3-23]NVK78427.1 DUF1684 domain-containing protein [Streptomyces morookaense]GHF50013.1 hypothetical protein GCM10010359_60590 [Streptomyces morookaense]